METKIITKLHLGLSLLFCFTFCSVGHCQWQILIALGGNICQRSDKKHLEIYDYTIDQYVKLYENSIANQTIPPFTSCVFIDTCSVLTASILAESIMPVILDTFEGKKKQNKILLSWTTASETNNAGYEVEHSLDAKQWTTIAFINGNGNSNTNKQFEYLHGNPTNGINYYRLKQIDFNDNFELLPIISVSINIPNTKTKLIPTPGVERLNFSCLNEVSKITIRNENDKIIKVTNQSDIDISDIPKGNYYCEIITEGRVLNKRFIKN
jgi:hypothetical protein